ncbi:hypothetical protein Uis1B_0485 [Bifidobacterium margollesii]|uniref:Uncharacterized protein n=2 Tax=Bifidobacterium margollesii TaxID=2020964 RepID=A0A2N5JBS8_9BIFI|nr:hypothetical protein Uis1B_0485 [Bifidobacterium margollesii]
MFDVDKVRAIMARYPHIHPEDSYLLDRYWKDLSDALLEDVDGTIHYLRSEATPEELERVSEVTDELAEYSQNAELIHAIQDAYLSHPETRKDPLLFTNLNISIGFLNDTAAAQQLLKQQPSENSEHRSSPIPRRHGDDGRPCTAETVSESAGSRI